MDLRAIHSDLILALSDLGKIFSLSEPPQLLHLEKKKKGGTNVIIKALQHCSGNAYKGLVHSRSTRWDTWLAWSVEHVYS